MELKEYKKKLGGKVESYSFLTGKETFGISIYENGFVLRKRGQTIVLDLINLLNLKDLISNFNKKKKILKQL